MHRGLRPLEHFDPDLVDLLRQRTRDLGIGIELQAEVKAIERVTDRLHVYAIVKGQAQIFEGEMVVHGAGRIPDLADLNLDSAGGRSGKNGVEVNEYLQSTSNPAVYAAGDAAAGGPPLTPVAVSDGEIVAANLLNGNHRKTDYRAVPSVVFTVPPLASVGLSEQRAREEGFQFHVHRDDTSGWYSSRRVGETCSGFKVLVEEKTDCVLGAHLLGPHAEETINLFALAIQFGLTAGNLASLGHLVHGRQLRAVLTGS